MGIIEVMNISEGEYCVADQPIIPEAKEENQNALPRPAPNLFRILIAKILIFFVPPNESLKSILLSTFVKFCQLFFLVRAIWFCDRFGNDKNRKIKD